RQREHPALHDERGDGARQDWERGASLTCDSNREARVNKETDLHYRNLAEVAADIRSRALSSEEVVRHTIERISRLDPRLRAFALVRADEALNEARAADARTVRGDALGPLHGVPIAVK